MGTPSYLKGFGTATGEQSSLGANNTDFFGEGLEAGGPDAPDAPASNITPEQIAAANLQRSATTTANINVNTNPYNQAVTPEQAAAAKPAGATGAYEAGSDASRAAMDENRDIQSPSSMGGFLEGIGQKVGVRGGGNMVSPGFTNPADFLNDAGQTVGVTGAGDAAFSPRIATNPVDAFIGNTQNLGTVDTPGTVGDVAPAAMDTMNHPEQVAADALTAAMNGDGAGSIPIDASGNDRGGMGLGGAYGDAMGRVQGIADTSRAGGQGVLNGSVAPGGAGANNQQDALDAAMGFVGGPRKANDVMTDVNGFLSAPGGPSAAELQLQQAAQGNMSDALSLARSGRARDAGSQARLMSQALANNAATNVDTARDTALLRAKEASDKRAQDLSALGLKGNLAQGVDTNTLGALGLQSDISNALRSGNIQERGQSLNYDQGQNQIGAGLESDVLKTIPQLENIRHQDQFDLTPQQKLAAAKLGGTPSKTTADYVTGLLGDVLSAL